MRYRVLLLGAFLLLLTLALAACQPAPAPTQPPPVAASPAQACPTAPACPPPPPAPTAPPAPTPVVAQVPNQDAWAGSPHNDDKAEAFHHWDSASPAEVPVTCAKCHSTQGFQDFLGADGSAVGKVDKTVPAPQGTLQCVACHNSATVSLSSVTFPSALVINDLGPEAICMTCHQGTSSKIQVDATLTKFGADKDLDTVPAKQGDSSLSFINVHYRAAGATLYGTQAKGGYEYEGLTYDVKNNHVTGKDTCIGCHDQHSLQLKLTECANCHTGVKTVEDVRKIRMNDSLVDYNGNGNVTEGLSEEIGGLRDMLYTAIQSYAKDVAGKPIVYDENTYPYFFVDTNGDGKADPDELKSDNAYTNWTGRLIKATYNYQFSVKDPGGYAHNGKYIIELLYDSIADLNTKLSTPVDLSMAHRESAGHFSGSGAPFRDWDAEGGIVPGTCAKCHAPDGLPQFLKEGVNVSLPAGDGMKCSTCHDDVSKFTRYQVSTVKFPSGAMLTFGENVDANLCINCHQGRESKVGVDATITRSGAKDDEVSDKLSFRNPHYFGAGATLFGTQAMGMYEYSGKQYNGRNMHQEGFNTCTDCHDSHALTIKFEKCANCHPVVKSAEDVTKIRLSKVDFNGNGDVTEGLASEVQTFADRLYASIQKYAADKKMPAIAYSADSYPYYFTDTNGNGKVDPEEAVSDNSYKSWTPRLLRAAFNYQWFQKDPGAFAHNGQYIMQIMYDSIQDLGGDVKGLTRPEVVKPAAQ